MDDFADDEYNFQDEYGAFQRRGYLERDVLAEVGIDVDRRTPKDMRNPTHRFYVYVDAVAKYIAANDIAGVAHRDVQNILKYIAAVPNAKYKNPTAFVLGFGVTKSNGTAGVINAKAIHRLKTDIPKFELAVRIEDIVRYARLWVNLRQTRL